MIPVLAAKNDIISGVAPSKYATSGCLSPIRRRIRLSEDGSYHEMYLDCGKCLRCLDARRNELASRMFLHSLDYEYVYFVTLTYGSYNLLPFKRHPFLGSWLQSVPIYDDFNSTHTNKWTPTLLVRQHLTNFLKRLRHSLNSQITYAACGEYGEHYCRPHFHVIVWSHEPIPKTKFEDAWSLDCKRTNDKYYIRPWRESDSLKTSDPNYFKFKIGKVDYEDLWANGTLNYDGKHPGQYETNGNAMNNFTYLAKYVGKTSDTWQVPTRLRSRWNRAFNMYKADSDALQKTDPHPRQDNLDIYKLLQTALDYDPLNFPIERLCDFEKIVSPFFVSSRRPSLGKPYFVKNAARFQAKSFGLPNFMGKPIAFPRYFFYLLSQKEYPIRLRKDVPSGVSLTKDLLPRLHSYLSAMREDKNYWYFVHGQYSYTEERPRNRIELYSLSNIGKYAFKNEYDVNKLYYTGSFDCVDLLSVDNSVVHYYYNPSWDFYEGYTYNRTTRSFDFYDYVPREDFCDTVLDLIESQYGEKLLQKKEKIHDMFFVTDSVENDKDTPTLRERFIQNRIEFQLKYNSSHINTL